MKGLCLIGVLAAISAISFAQEDQLKGLSAKTKAYHEYRLEDTEPIYGLRKVKALIAKAKEQSEEVPEVEPKGFASLSNAEKFTYCMLHGEDYSQNCDVMPTLLNEEKKICAHPPDLFYGSYSWSARQRNFLKTHRSAVIGFLRSTIRSQHRVGVNLKAAIIELDAYELIPDLVSVYKGDGKDQDILTVLLLLMKDGKFRPFLVSRTYQKLYKAKDADYKTSIDANPLNVKLAIDRAMSYYKSRKA